MPYAFHEKLNVELSKFLMKFIFLPFRFEARVVREFREIREAIRVSHMDCACVRNAVGAFQAINYLVNKLDPDRADGPSSKFSPRDNGHGGGRGGGRGGKRQFNRY